MRTVDNVPVRAPSRPERGLAALVAPGLVVLGSAAMAAAAISRDPLGIVAALLGVVTVFAATLHSRRSDVTRSARRHQGGAPWAAFIDAREDLFEPAAPAGATAPTTQPALDADAWAVLGAWPIPPAGLDDPAADGRPGNPISSLDAAPVAPVTPIDGSGPAGAADVPDQPAAPIVEAKSLLVPKTRPMLVWSVQDAVLLARRSLLRLVRTPQLLVLTLVQPVMFVLLFRYVFGGAIASALGGRSYVDFLMPGIFVQTVAFSSVSTGLGIVDDLSRGVMDRFRSLPMAPSAVLSGRVLADVVKNTLALATMLAVGLMIGFRFSGGLAGAGAALGLVLAAGVAFSWIGLALGLRLRNSEAAQSAGLLWLFPITFASSAFVPVSSLPGWLQAFARYQPITEVVDATRDLFAGVPSGRADLSALSWLVGLVVVFAVLASQERRSLDER